MAVLSAPNKTPQAEPAKPVAQARVELASTSVGEHFNTLLDKFVKHVKVNMGMALELSHIAFSQFQEHGNLDCAIRFLQAMPENYLRRVAFAKWMVAHSPCKVVQAKLVKDKERADLLGDDAFDAKGAMSKPFWDFAPEAPIIDYTAQDIREALIKTLKTFQGKRKRALDADATAQYNLAENLLNQMPVIVDGAASSSNLDKAA